MIELLTNFAATCDSSKLFDIFPSWDTFLTKTTDANGHCIPALHGINDIWLIVAAVIEILLRLATLAAVAVIIYAGVLYTTSQGSPDQTTRAKNTIVNALVGLAIALSAIIFVQFIASKF